MMNILDELTYAKELLKNGFNKYVNIKDLIILAKYFRQNGIEEDRELENVLIDFCKKHEPEFNEVLQGDKIDIAVRKSRVGVLRVPIEIPITEIELDTIRAIKNYRYEKVLFTMLVLAKYYKLTNTGKKVDSKKYYISMKQSSIFRMAHTTQKRNENIFYELGKLGLIDSNLRYGSYFFTFADTEDKSDIKIIISDINKIVDFYGFACIECGKEILKNSNSHRMCGSCWKSKRKVDTRERMH